jgi:hypothetical protein
MEEDGSKWKYKMELFFPSRNNNYKRRYFVKRKTTI